MGTPPRGKAEPGKPAEGRPASRKGRAAEPARGTRTEAYPKRTGLRPGNRVVGVWGTFRENSENIHEKIKENCGLKASRQPALQTTWWLVFPISPV